MADIPKLPQNVVSLVIAAREAFDTGMLPDDEQAALDKALEPFAAAVPYDNEPTRAAPPAPIAEGVTCVAKPLTDDERKAAIDKWMAPPAMDREAVEKVEAAWATILKEFGYLFEDARGRHYPEVKDMESAIRTLPADAIRQGEGCLKAREEGYRAGYLHVLGLARAGVPTKDFERDVGAYMADFVGGRP